MQSIPPTHRHVSRPIPEISVRIKDELPDTAAEYVYHGLYGQAASDG